MPTHGERRPETAPGSEPRRYRLVRFGEVGSTNDIVLEAAQAGAKPGLVVQARTQARGKGRKARDWSSPKGGLWASVLLDPSVQPAIGGHVPLAVGSAVAEALTRLGAPVTVRWPNDLMLDDRKVGGILVESRTEGERFSALAAGLGINVQNEPPMAGTATLAEAVTGFGPDDVLDAVLHELGTTETWLTTGNVRRLCERFMARAWGIDRDLFLDGEPCRPKEIAIDGALIVERPERGVDVVRSGSLRVGPP